MYCMYYYDLSEVDPAILEIPWMTCRSSIPIKILCLLCPIRLQTSIHDKTDVLIYDEFNNIVIVIGIDKDVGLPSYTYSTNGPEE